MLEAIKTFTVGDLFRFFGSIHPAVPWIVGFLILAFWKDFLFWLWGLACRLVFSIFWRLFYLARRTFRRWRARRSKAKDGGRVEQE